MAEKRGAKALAPAKPAVAPLSGELLDERREKLAVMNAQQTAVIAQFGDGLPWHPDHYEAEIRSELRRGCESFLRAGRYLVVARECATHGEWENMMRRLGIEPRHAHRMMETARRLANRSTSTDLLEAVGTSSKLIELLSLPEEQFKELATDGATGELEIDDVADMTVSELRAAVRKVRAVIKKRDSEIDTYKENLANARREWVEAKPNKRVQKLRANVRAAADEVIRCVGNVNHGLWGAIAMLLEDEDAKQQDQAEFLAAICAEMIGNVASMRDNQHVHIETLEPRALRTEV